MEIPVCVIISVQRRHQGHALFCTMYKTPDFHEALVSPKKQAYREPRVAPSIYIKLKSICLAAVECD